MSVFKDLVGQRINGIFLAKDDWQLAFRTTEGRYYTYRTENDCCNSVWFNHVNGVNLLGEGNSFDLLRGLIVTGSEDKGWGENREDSAYEVVQDGFWSIHTERGYIDLEVRNSHNGYYGGSVAFVGVEDALPDDAREIKEDF